MAPYMAARGIGTIGLVPILLAYAILGEKGSFVPALVIVALTGGIPFARTITGVVKAEGDDIIIRNPFRSVRLPVRLASKAQPVALWQNFFVVAGLVTEGDRQRTIKIPALSADDVPALDALLRSLREDR